MGISSFGWIHKFSDFGAYFGVGEGRRSWFLVSEGAIIDSVRFFTLSFVSSSSNTVRRFVIGSAN